MIYRPLKLYTPIRAPLPSNTQPPRTPDNLLDLKDVPVIDRLIRCAQAFAGAQPLFSHIYPNILFAPQRIHQYLDYIDIFGVKSFVLVEI